MTLSRAALLLFLSIMASTFVGCRSPNVHKIARHRNDSLSIAGGFWEGYSSAPSIYYGLTFVESRGELLGTCFQGGTNGIRLFFLEKCTLQGNHFEGWKTYPPWSLEDMVEGTFDGDSCQFIEYYMEGHANIILHRVEKLSKMPNVFRDPPSKNQ